MTNQRRPSRKRHSARQRPAAVLSLGDRIRKLRIERGLSQEVVAPQADISVGWFNQIENGHVDPRYSHLVAIAGVLGVDLFDLLCDRDVAATGHNRRSDVSDGATLKSDGPDQFAANLPAEVVARLQEEILELTRRQAIAGGAVWAGAIVGAPTNPEPWERLAYALRHPGRVDQQTVAHLEEITVALGRLEPVSASEGLLGPVVGHLDTIGTLLRGPLPPAIRGALAGLAAETAGLAGWLRWIVDDTASADRYYRVALDAAQEAGDLALAAYLMGRAACQPFYREQPDVRLERLAAIPREDATPRTQAWLVTLEAEAHAIAGRGDAACRALDRAASVLSQVTAVEDAPRPRVIFMDDVWLAGQRGAVLAKLGHTDEAITTLQGAIAELDPLWLKHRTWLLVILASAHARRENPVAASRIGTEALGLATQLRAEADLQLVAGLRGDLAPWAATFEVAHFTEQVRTALGA